MFQLVCVVHIIIMVMMHFLEYMADVLYMMMPRLICHDNYNVWMQQLCLQRFMIGMAGIIMIMIIVILAYSWFRFVYTSHDLEPGFILCCSRRLWR